MYTTLEDIKFQPQLIDPRAAKNIGRSRAAVLMQMIYWSKKSKNIIDGRKWFYNPIRVWNNQISYYSESTIKRAICFLEKHGFIISRKMFAKKCDHTKWYSIVEEEVISFFKEVHFRYSRSATNEINEFISYDQIPCKSSQNRLGQNEPIDQVILTHSIIKTTAKINNDDSSTRNKRINNLKKNQSEITEEEKSKRNFHNSLKERRQESNSYYVETSNIAMKELEVISEVVKTSPCFRKHNSVCRINGSFVEYQKRNKQNLDDVSAVIATKYVENNNKLQETSYKGTKNEDYRCRKNSYCTKKILETDSSPSTSKTYLTEKELSELHEMKLAWNKVFESSISPISAYVSKKNATYLYKLLKEKFGGNIEKWKTYAKLVNSSKFLMGEKETKKGFKAQFGWLIQHDVIDKIFSGEYGVGDRVLDQDNISENIAQKKKMIAEKSVRKISEYLKSRLSDSSERSEFNSYLLSGEYNNDGDKYGIKGMIRGRSAEGMVLLGQEPFLYSMLYESYLSKKYIGHSYFNSKAEINKLLDNLSYKNTGASFMEVLRGVSRKIDAIDFSKMQVGEVYQMISV